MIRLIPNPTFRAKVKFSQPGTDELAVVEFEFRHKAPKAMEEWFAASKERADAEAMGEVVVGWSGVTDEQGNVVAYSQEMLAVFMAAHGPRSAELVRAYIREMVESRQKN